MNTQQKAWPKKLSMDALVEATHNAYEPLHRLHALCETFCYLKAPRFKKFAHFFFDMHVHGMHSLRWHEYRKQHDTAALFHSFTLGSWQGKCGLYVSRPLMCYLLDAFLGGDTSADVVLGHTTKPVTRLEQKRAQDFCATLLEEVQTSLNLHAEPIIITSQQSVLDVQGLTLADDDDKILILECTVNVDYHEGDIHIILPYLALDPLYASLKPHHVCHTLEPADQAWHDHLHNKTRESTSVLDAVLYTHPHSLKDVLSWHEGTVLDLNMPPSNPDVEIQCQGQMLGRGIVQAEDDRLTVIIT